tara:strand:- start:72 stop:491 length:420 start_codon:yes stop_codon:yes gene_type:complete
MKKLLPILCVLIITSCSKEVPSDQLVGELDGFIQSYFENGQLETSGQYKNGKKDGVHERYFVNGQVMLKEKFLDGNRDGLNQSFHMNGQLKTEIYYKDGKGILQFFTEDGLLENIYCFQDNPEIMTEVPLNGVCEFTSQ